MTANVKEDWTVITAYFLHADIQHAKFINACFIWYSSYLLAPYIDSFFLITLYYNVATTFTFPNLPKHSEISYFLVYSILYPCFFYYIVLINFLLSFYNISLNRFLTLWESFLSVFFLLVLFNLNYILFLFRLHFKIFY